MPTKPANEHAIDLICTLCPKEPRFSDVSHLLTHMASKSHLSHQHKLKIKSYNDAEAEAKLAEFTHWEQAHGIGRLLFERTENKDKKKPKRSRASGSSSRSTKAELESQSERSNPFEEGTHFRAPVPRMSELDVATHDEHEAFRDWESAEYKHIYATPTANRKLPGFGDYVGNNNKIDPKLMTPKKPEQYDVDQNAPQSSDSAKLKGTIWPGMDIFDAATPEQKRLRNQKKDDSVIKDMIATSLETEPAELSYHANGEFRASRDIFGPLSTETSPVVPSPKKRKTRKAPTFNNMSTNTRVRAQKVKRGSGQTPVKNDAQEAQSRPQYLFPPPILNPLAAASKNEADEEHKMTYQMRKNDKNGKKRPFNVFQDGPQPSPSRTESPLEEHRFDLPHINQPFDGASNTAAPASPPPYWVFNGFRDELLPAHTRLALTQTDVRPMPETPWSQVYVNPFGPLNHFQHESFSWTTAPKEWKTVPGMTRFSGFPPPPGSNIRNRARQGPSSTSKNHGNTGGETAGFDS